MSGGNWASVAVVNGNAVVVCPGTSGEVGVCSGVNCDWNTEYMYNLLDAGVGPCAC